MKGILALFIVLFALFTATGDSSAATDSPLIFGVFPRQNAELSYEFFTPIAEYLSAELGKAVILDVSDDFPEFWRKLKNKSFDIIYCNQYHYLAAHRDFQYDVVGTSVEFGRSTIAGAIIVRKDSNFNSLLDLRGKKILFGGDSFAMQSYVIATQLLRQAGLNSGDYQEVFAINPLNGILAVYYEQVDAAGASDLVLQLPSLKNRIDGQQLTILAHGKQLPQLPWGVSSELSLELRLMIRKALTTMDQSLAGAAALEAASLDKIIPAKDKDFDSFREIILETKGEVY